MTAPPGLRNAVMSLAATGVGWEDCCVRLRVPSEMREAVRSIVLEIPRLRGVMEPPASAGSVGGSTDTR